MTTQRHHGMDWLRIGAFGLLILYHIGMYFVPWGWHVKIAQPLDWVPGADAGDEQLAARVAVPRCRAMRAPHCSQSSAAVGAFARSRSARLLIPLVFGIIIIIPPQPWIELVGQHGYAHGFLHFWRADYFRFGSLDGIVLPTWQHLWFVVYLWVYTLLAAAVLALLPAEMRARIGRWRSAASARRGLLVWPLALWLLVYAAFPDHDETHALFDDGPSHLHYLVPFLVGWLLRVRPQLFDAVARCWRFALAIAVAAFGVVAWIMSMWLTGAQPADWGRLPFDIAHLVQGWATIVALVGVADVWWNCDHPWRTTLAEAVFPFYIIHQTIIVVTGWYLLQAGVGALPSFLILVAATVAGCWLFYWIGRNISWLRPLIGLQRKQGRA